MTDLQTLSALVLEDEFIIAMDLQDMLQGWGFGAVRVAHDGEEARALLAGGGADIVLADYHLPDGTSASFIAEAQASGSTVVVLTGQALEQAVLEGMGRPAVVEKPVHPDALREVVMGALGRS